MGQCCTTTREVWHQSSEESIYDTTSPAYYYVAHQTQLMVKLTMYTGKSHRTAKVLVRAAYVAFTVAGPAQPAMLVCNSHKMLGVRAYVHSRMLQQRKLSFLGEDS